MSLLLSPSAHLKDMWEVLVLYLIPVGGGIPAGVLLGNARGLEWPLMLALYFVSDVILACIFEPLMLLIILAGKRVAFLTRFVEAFRQSVKKSVAYYGNHKSPLALILISFGVDPMTGRAAARAAGHGFVSGWLIAITGDMFYFALIMACTLWLKSILGDGTTATMVILGLMIVAPWAIRRLRKPKLPTQQL